MDLELPRFKANFSIKRSKDAPYELFTYEGQVPERLMSAYAKIVGNGLAKVSVSADYSLKEFGSGTSSMASVSLSCNQDEASIREAAELAADLAREFAYKNAVTASGHLKELKNEVS